MGAVISTFRKLFSKCSKNKNKFSRHNDPNTCNVNSTYYIDSGKIHLDTFLPALNVKKTIFVGKYEDEVPAAVTKINVVNSELKQKKSELKKLAKKLNRKTLPDKFKRLISVNQKLISGNKNIVKYFCYEIDKKSLCVYVAYELCDHTISDYIQNKGNFPTLTTKEVILQLVKGVQYLHEIKILHRNLKPTKVLIKTKQDKAIVKICGFGVSKCIPDANSSISNSGKYGEPGYIAPEIYNAQQNFPPGTKLNKCYKTSSDIFPLGAVICFIGSNGHHAFSRQEDIQNKLPPDFNKFEGDFTLKVLVRDKMLAQNFRDRPSAKDILRHPALWSSTETLDFFHQTSNLLKDSTKLQMCSIESNANNVLRGNSWKIHLTFHIEKYLFPITRRRTSQRQASYDETSVLSLIRALRNLKEHFHELPVAVKSDLGSSLDSCLNYWMDKFPEILIHTYTCMRVHSSESSMKQFYK